MPSLEARRRCDPRGVLASGAAARCCAAYTDSGETGGRPLGGVAGAWAWVADLWWGRVLAGGGEGDGALRLHSHSSVETRRGRLPPTSAAQSSGTSFRATTTLAARPDGTGSRTMSSSASCHSQGSTPGSVVIGSSFTSCSIASSTCSAVPSDMCFHCGPVRRSSSSRLPRSPPLKPFIAAAYCAPSSVASCTSPLCALPGGRSGAKVALKNSDGSCASGAPELSTDVLALARSSTTISSAVTRASTATKAFCVFSAKFSTMPSMRDCWSSIVWMRDCEPSSCASRCSTPAHSAAGTATMPPCIRCCGDVGWPPSVDCLAAGGLEATGAAA
mmetsp:Transcript_38363/g.98081  ORF Transcript_38363/g.98081 Transcript_38363/m.98081 type:complete len:331 (+) Transcript_38363:232-1224(+)